jgi:hypothetical protein
MGSTTIVRSHQPIVGSEEGARPGIEEVKEQLARLLSSPLFHHSKHYPSFLRYVVNETLDGQGGHLKERALGVEVFGRSADYDTNADPVVRTSACEVRKRIAQYYHEPGHEREIRIDLPSGSYIPEFRYPAATTPRPLALVVEAQPAPAAMPDLPGELLQRKRMILAIAASLAAVLVLGAAMWVGRGPTAIERFWGPVWGPAESVMMAVGTPPEKIPPSTPAATSDDGPTFRDVMRADNLAFADALTMARITGVAREYAKKRLDVRRATAYTLTDLRKGSLILVGAFNNPWTMRLTKDLRFSYERREDHTGLIRDRQNPGNTSWLHDPNVLYSKLNQDYAIVSRFVDPLTERTVVAVGGMGRDGTLAAGEFVTEPRYLEMLANRAPKNWEKKNLQVVLATDIVRGNTGPPRILAAHFW